MNLAPKLKTKTVAFLVVVGHGDGERLVEAGTDAARAGGAVRPRSVLLEPVVRRDPPPGAVVLAAQPQELQYEGPSADM